MQPTVIKKNAEQYWLNKFSEGLVDYPLPWETTGAARRGVAVNIPVSIASEIITICKGSDMAIQVLLSSTLALCIRRYINTDRFVLNFKIKGELVPIRVSCGAEDVWGTVLEKIKKDVSESLGQMDYDHEQFLRKLALRNGQAIDHLFKKVLISDDEVETQDDYNLHLQIQRKENTVEASLQVNCSEVWAKVVEHLAESFVMALGNIRNLQGKKLNTIDIIGPKQRSLLLKSFNPENSMPEAGSVLELFAQQVSHSPNSRALIHGEQQVTYRKLDHISGRIAADIHNGGVRQEENVAVLLDRSIDLVAAFIGILKAGAAFLPIDPEYPAERIAHILKDSKARWLITSEKYSVGPGDGIQTLIMEDLDQNGDLYNSTSIEGKNLAYIIYTSGTTGLPNGVMVEHSSLLNLCNWHNRYYQTSAEDISTKYAGQGFDATIWEIFPPLVSGGALYIVDDKHRHTIHELNEDFIRNGVTISFLPTQLGEQFIALDNPVLQKLLLGGDKLRRFNKNVSYQVYNNYGPSENTVVSTAGRVTAQSSNIPIGKPIDNTRIYILAPCGQQLQPIGVPGQLCISGEGLARGYWNNGALTQKRFKEHPLEPGKRIYYTGDMARWLPEGEIEFLGREDNQVKIRGYRIELEEIENTLLRYEAIKDAVVVKKQGAESQAALCAYYVSDITLQEDELRSFLKAIIPSYMVPTWFIPLKSIPITANGKADRAYLEKKEEAYKAGKKVYRAPENETEAIIQEVWQTVLGIEQIGTEDNFFHLGGDSIIAIQIESRLQSKGYVVRNIFDNPTIKALAAKAIKKNGNGYQGLVAGSLPLTPIQQQFFADPGISNKNHYNQALMLEFDELLSPEQVTSIFQAILSHHDALRITFSSEEGDIVARNHENIPLVLHVYELGDSDTNNFIIEKCNEIQAGIDLENGPLLQLALFQNQQSSKVAVIIHHLVIDGVSWRILLEDIEILYQRDVRSKSIKLPLKTDSYKLYAEYLVKYAASPELLGEKGYWTEVLRRSSLVFEPVQENKTATKEFKLDEQNTAALLLSANRVYNTNITQLLLAALSLSVSRTFNAHVFLIWLEGHGRENVLRNLDIRRTVGWFTSIFPVLVDMTHAVHLEDILVRVKDNLNRVPNNGVGYGILKHITGCFEAGDIKQKDIVFNYLGQFDYDVKGSSFHVAGQTTGLTSAIENKTAGELEVNSLIVDKRLSITVNYNAARFDTAVIDKWAESFQTAIKQIVSYCSGQQKVVATPSDYTYQELSFETVKYLNEKYPVSDIYTLSPAQEGMLFHSKLDKNSLNYFEYVKYEVNADFRVGNMEKALDLLHNRYEILRTKFYYENLKRPVQIVLDRYKADLRYEDLSSMDERVAASRVEAHLIRCRQVNFDEGPLFSLTVFKQSSSRFIFVWSFHHILMDGWSAMLLCNDFHDLYRFISEDKLPQLNEVKPYRDHIKWLESKRHDLSGNFWKVYLAGFSQLTPIISATKQKGATDYKDHTLVLQNSLTNQLQEVAADGQVTLNALMQGIWAIFLSRHSNALDVLFGKVVSGRPSEVEGVESMVGLFINTVPLRVKLDLGEKFIELIQRIHQEAVICEPHQHLGLAEIQSKSSLDKNILDHIFVFENYPTTGDTKTWLQNIEFYEQTNYDFNVIIVPGSELKVTFKYNGGVLDDQYVNIIRTGFLQIARQVAANSEVLLGELELTDEQDRDLLLNKFNHSYVRTPEQSFLEMFMLQVDKQPHGRALIYKDQQLTYRQLDRLSDTYAGLLAQKHLAKGSVVGILVDRSIEMIAGVIGILKAGYAFLPIDPEYPGERVKHMISDSGVSHIFTTKEYAARFSDYEVVLLDHLDSQAWTKPSLPKAGMDDLAYVIYTSGTTGVPNGVMITHQSLAALCNWHNHYYNLSAKDISTKYAGFSFDATVWEIFPPLSTGGALYIIDNESRLSLEQLNTRYMQQGVTVSFLPTPVAEQFMHKDNVTLKKLLVGGDKLKYVNEKLTYEVYNNYGPTENTVVSTACKVEKSSHNIPIGKPVDTTYAYVLFPGTEKLQPVGMAGELCVAGVGLAKGYFGNAALTLKKFINNPFRGGEKMYRTGDLVRWLPDGNIEFLGRVDQQIKVRGYRIEPGEIENKLREHPEIDDCAIIAKSNNSGQNLLYALYTPGKEISADILKSFLLESLPYYMVPSFFIALPEMPINHNGKLDRAGLMTFCENHQPLSVTASTPATALQQTIAGIWEDVLGIEGINRDDNFFDLGGNSLDMMRIMDKLIEKVDNSSDNLLMQMFKYPTVNMLAAFLEDPSAQANKPDQENAESKKEALSKIRNNRLKQRKMRKA